MVRLKSRYILCEIIHPNGQEKRVPSERELYAAIFEELQEMHGDYGTASTTDAPPIRVKYLNSATNIVLIRVKRGLHKLVQSSMVFVKNIGSVDAFLRTLHLGGTIRSCCKFLIKYHKTQLPLLLQKCTTAGGGPDHLSPSLELHMYFNYQPKRQLKTTLSVDAVCCKFSLQAEREKVQQAIITSCQECNQKLGSLGLPT